MKKPVPSFSTTCLNIIATVDAGFDAMSGELVEKIATGIVEAFKVTRSVARTLRSFARPRP